MQHSTKIEEMGGGKVSHYIKMHSQGFKSGNLEELFPGLTCFTVFTSC